MAEKVIESNLLILLELFFLGGIALGAIGACAVSRGKLDLKPLATDLISRGLEVKDAVLAKADAVREDVEDMVAEARAASGGI